MISNHLSNGVYLTGLIRDCGSEFPQIARRKQKIRTISNQEKVRIILLWCRQRIAYCCLKDNPLDVAVEIIAESACLNAVNVKWGKLTEEGGRILPLGQHQIKSENLVLFPYNKVAQLNQTLSIVETSGTEVVISDDINGLPFDSGVAIERFMHQLKNATPGSNTVVIAIYNMPFL